MSGERIKPHESSPQTQNGRFPDIYQRRGLTQGDIDTFADMYQLSDEDARTEILYFEVQGSDIARVQSQYSKNGVELSRNEAARLHYDARFVNRTVDARENQKAKP